MPRLIALLAAWLALGAAAAPPVRFTVTDLGLLPGHASCVALGLNAHGHVVGACAPTVENFNQMGFVWKGGPLQPVGRIQQGQYSVATAINASGAVAGDGDMGNRRPQGWVRLGGEPVSFFDNAYGSTHAAFIADSGWIGGFYTRTLPAGPDDWRGAVWLRDRRDPRRFQRIDLPVLPGGSDPAAGSSVPYAFNQAGQAVGYATNDRSGRRATLWAADARRTPFNLGVYPGDEWSLARGINERGQVAGESRPLGGSRAVMWDADPARTMRLLPLLPGDNQGSAHAINGPGQILGRSWRSSGPDDDDDGPSRVVIWRDGGVHDLQALLDAGGAAWTLVAAIAINDRGQIAATARPEGADGRQRAVLLTPVPAPR